MHYCPECITIINKLFRPRPNSLPPPISSKVGEGEAKNQVCCSLCLDVLTSTYKLSIDAILDGVFKYYLPLPSNITGEQVTSSSNDETNTSSSYKSSSIQQKIITLRDIKSNFNCAIQLPPILALNYLALRLSQQNFHKTEPNSDYEQMRKRNLVDRGNVRCFETEVKGRMKEILISVIDKTLRGLEGSNASSFVLLPSTICEPLPVGEEEETDADRKRAAKRMKKNDSSSSSNNNKPPPPTSFKVSNKVEEGKCYRFCKNNTDILHHIFRNDYTP